MTLRYGCSARFNPGYTPSGSNQMHVVHLINTLENAGAERLVADIVSHSNGEEYSTSVIQLGGGESLRSRIERAGCDVVNLDGALSPLGVPRLLIDTRRALSEIDPDVVHTHLPLGHVVGRLAGASCAIPAIVSTYHSVPAHKGRAKTTAERVTEPLADAVVTISEGVRAAYGSPDGWTVIHNGIDVDDFNERTRSVSPSASLPTDRHLLLNVGRCVEPKRQLDLIAAMGHVVRKRQDVHLAIVGGGPLESKLRDAKQAIGVDEFVTLVGYESDIVPYYAAADVFVAASTHEGLPTTHLEAMAAALPIVSTDIPGVREVVVDGETGRLVAPKRPARLAECILDVIDAKENLGERGLQLARDQFTLEKTIADHTELYRALGQG